MSAATTVRCHCRLITGARCDWTGPSDKTVLVRWVPPQHRATVTALGGRGVLGTEVYEHTIRVHEGCAEHCVEEYDRARGEMVASPWAESVAESKTSKAEHLAR